MCANFDSDLRIQGTEDPNLRLSVEVIALYFDSIGEESTSSLECIVVVLVERLPLVLVDQLHNTDHSARGGFDRRAEHIPRSIPVLHASNRTRARAISDVLGTVADVLAGSETEQKLHAILLSGRRNRRKLNAWFR